jgi:hypothetical protein
MPLSALHAVPWDPPPSSISRAFLAPLGSFTQLTRALPWGYLLTGPLALAGPFHPNY